MGIGAAVAGVLKSAWFATAVTAVSTGIGIYSNIQQSRQAAAIGQANQKIAEQQAKVAREQAAENQKRQQRNFKRFMGAFNADIAAHGGTPGQGTARFLARSAVQEGEIDQRNLLTDGELASRNYQQQGRIARYEGDSRSRQFGFSALGSALNGYANWRQMTG